MLSVSDEERTRVFLALVFAFLSCRSFGYSYIAVLFFMVSWIFYVFLRYSFNFLKLPFLIRLIAGFLYGLILIYLMVGAHSELDENLTILAGIYAFISIWFLLLSWSDLVTLIFLIRP